MLALPEINMEFTPENAGKGRRSGFLFRFWPNFRVSVEGSSKFIVEAILADMISMNALQTATSLRLSKRVSVRTSDKL